MTQPGGNAEVSVSGNRRPTTSAEIPPPCPATYNGVPCVKRRVLIGGEWIHGGGHMFMTDEQQRRLDTDPDAAREFLTNARPVPKEAIRNG